MRQSLIYKIPCPGISNHHATNLLRDKPQRIRQWNSSPIMVVVVSYLPSIVAISSGRIGASTDSVHGPVQEKSGHEFQSSCHSLGVLGVDVHALVPSSLHGMDRSPKSELRVMPDISASLLRYPSLWVDGLTPELRHIPSVSCDPSRQCSVGLEVEVCGDARSEAGNSSFKLGGIFIEHCNRQHCINLRQVDVAIPRTHRVQLRVEGSSEHRLQLRHVARLPAGIQSQYLCRGSEDSADPPRQEFVLVRAGDKPCQSGPCIQNGYGAFGVYRIS